MLAAYLLTYNNAFLGPEESHEVPLIHTQGEITAQYGNRLTQSPALNHTWLVPSDSREGP